MPLPTVSIPALVLQARAGLKIRGLGFRTRRGVAFLIAKTALHLVRVLRICLIVKRDHVVPNVIPNRTPVTVPWS
jgi:hypothetical protein